MNNNKPALFLDFPRWHRLAASLILCTVTLVPPALQPVFAQDPSRNEATLNFVGADIDSVIKAVGHYTGTTFVIDPRVKGTINLVSEKPVTKSQALSLLSSALRLQGYAMVSVGALTKVVPEADAKLQAGPIQAGKAHGDQIATQIFRLNYENAAVLVPVLRPLISPNNTISADTATNSLVITDYADNLRRLGRIIASLDGPSSADMDVVPIRYAVASDIAVMVNRLLDTGAGTNVGAGDLNKVSLLADPRTNSVIVRAPSVARANLAKSLIAKLDQPTSMPGNVHVVYLKNAEATRLAQTLRAVVAYDTAGSATQGTTPTTQPSPQPTTTPTTSSGGTAGLQAPPSSPAPQQGPLPTGGPGGFIQADPATNSLIITASEPVYRNLRAVIEKLDARRAQVYVESLIVEVTSKRAAELGIQWAGLSGDSNSRYRIGTITGFNSGGNNLITNIAAGLTNTTPTAPGNGISLGLFRQIGGKLTLGAIAHALETDDNANILSMPNLITLDNEEARIIVGQNVPFVTGQYTTAASGGTAGVNPFQTIERRDIGLSLRVRPQVSEGGTVKMAIYQETSAIQDTTTSGIITSKRSIDTNVLVDDGQIIVLGGLIDDNMQDGQEKVPGLGDVPVLGNFFKYRTRSRTKTNLMVFLRPTVVRTAEQGVDVAADRYAFIRGQEVNSRPEQTVVMPNLGGPQLPPLQNGQLRGGPLLDLTPGTLGGNTSPTQQGAPGGPGQPMNLPPAAPVLNGQPMSTAPAGGPASGPPPSGGLPGSEPPMAPASPTGR